MERRCSIQQGEKITVDQSKVLKIDRIDCSVFSGPPGIVFMIIWENIKIYARGRKL